MANKNNMTRQGVRNLDSLPSASKGKVLSLPPTQCDHKRTKLDGSHIYCKDCGDLLFDSGLHGHGERVMP